VTVFVDTSVLYGLLDAGSEGHQPVASEFRGLLLGGEELATSGLVVIETDALLRRRLGMEAVRELHTRILPLIQVFWPDSEMYRAVVTPYLSSGRAGPSLVDYASFALMRAHGIRTVLALDRHFAQQGFDCLPRGAV